MDHAKSLRFLERGSKFVSCNSSVKKQNSKLEAKPDNRFIVTHHASKRWKERGFGNYDLLQIFLASEILYHPNSKGDCKFIDREKGCIFACQINENKTKITITTVMKDKNF